MAGFTVGTDRVDCRLWANINGTGTPAVRDDYNVSSIADRGTGLLTVTIDTDLGNNDYAVAGVCGNTGQDDRLICGKTPQTGGYFHIDTKNIANNFYDVDFAGVMVFGAE